MSRPVFPIVLIVAALALHSSLLAETPPTFKVASWNIRSGMGIKALTGGFGAMFSSATQNCTDPTKPMNAWGWGLPQQELTAAIAGDPSVIALGLQEAWGCGRASNVRDVLGWRYASADLNGTALVARYGISGSLFTKRIATRGVDGSEDQYLFGADVCGDEACTWTARVYTVHYTGRSNAQFVMQIQNTIRAIDMQPSADANVVVGDFNIYQRDLVVKRCGAAAAESPGLVEWARHQYVDAWALLRPGEDGDTGMSNRNGCGVPNGGLFKRIDYVMARGFAPLSVDRWAMIAPGVQDAPSDHAGIIATVAPAGIVVDPPPPPHSEIVIWPGRQPSIVGARWQVESDPTAAGGYAIVNPNLGDSKRSTALAEPESYVDVTFEADADTAYRMWIRARAAADNWANDSVLVQFSDAVDAAGQPVFRIGTNASTWWSLEEFINQGVHGWGWQDNGYGTLDATGPEIRFAAAGLHTLRLQQREDGITIDQIVLSSALYMTERPGTQRDDTTILPEQR